MVQAQRVPLRSRTARFNEVLNILVRNDLWGLLRTMLTGRETEAADPAPVRLRSILEELGPTFIKIGQLLATRPDLVPAPYVEELKKLYDKTTPNTYDEMRQVVREELGRDVEDVFASFEPQAIASASVGQVHRATLRDGTPVAVKVQHPGIEEAMLLDFRILRRLAVFVEKTFAASRVWQPTDHLEEVRAMLERELDYRYEAKNCARMAHNFRHDPNVHVPQVFRELCTKRVMVMEYVDGVKFTHPDHPALAGLDLRRTARVVTHAMARQIFIHRFFHADPSPGNIILLESDRIALIDFGAVGVVTERRAKAILDMLLAIGRGDGDGASEAILDLCEQKGEYDSRRFQNDVERILDFFEREEVSVADPRMMEMILQLARDHHMLLPPDFMRITRALFQFDGFCRDMDPDYELVSVLEPMVHEIAWHGITSERSRRELLEETLGESMRLLRSFPHTLNRLARRVERNELSIKLEMAGMEGIKRSQGRNTLKTGFTVMMAALLVALGILYAGPEPSQRLLPFLFAAGTVLVVWALVLVVWSEGFRGRRD